MVCLNATLGDKDGSSVTLKKYLTILDVLQLLANELGNYFSKKRLLGRFEMLFVNSAKF